MVETNGGFLQSESTEVWTAETIFLVSVPEGGTGGYFLQQGSLNF